MACMQVGMGIKGEVILVRGGREEHKGKEKEKGKGEKGKKERDREEEKGREKKGEKEVGVSMVKTCRTSKVYIFDEGYAPRGRDSSYFGLFSTIRGCFLKYGNVVLF